jgi:uncharacterized protein YdeI (YjbR/CyaY-like superfamily)
MTQEPNSSSEKKPLIFASAAALRQWLARNHGCARVLWAGLYNQRAGKTSLTYKEAVDEALCFGWIDGVRKSVDSFTYTVRFTPRKRGSNWSAVNIKRATELTEMRRMTPPGLAAFENRSKKRDYSYEQQRAIGFDRTSEMQFKDHASAWEFFQRQAPWYRRTSSFWVMSAKREETRQRRLQKLISDSAAGRRLGMLTPKGGKSSG